MKFSAKEWAVLGLFSSLTLLMLYPLSMNLTAMVPEPTDPLLNAWRMQWNARSFLDGPTAIANIFDANIFYPYPLTLAYSEHFLMIAAQALPFLLLADSHLFGMNLSVLVTFVLSGYGAYLLVTAWTRSRWAGLVAGLLFAFSPQRFGQLNHLELLVTQWMPFALLALHWTLTRSGRRYPTLFAIFFNLQLLSGFHYGLNLTVACLLMTAVYALFRRVCWRRGLWAAGAVSILATLLLNWPIWRVYLHFSDVMGAVRTPGEVRVYSAAITDYLTTIPHNLLYGWTFGRWASAGRQFQPLMPFGLIGMGLVLIAIMYALRFTFHTSRLPTNAAAPPRLDSYRLPTIMFLLLLSFTGLLLSFGLNENALGSSLAPLLEYSPYSWLYENLAFVQGIRVPGRYSLLLLLGLTGLAGWGAALLLKLFRSDSERNTQYAILSRAKSRGRNTFYSYLLPTILSVLILLESWSAPLVGPTLPVGSEIPAVYHWLRQETPEEAVVLELPFKDHSEFLYEYYASHHWRRLANGGTGYTPPSYKELRRWFESFPDARSVDVIQQMEIDWLIVHPELYEPDEWQRIQDELPRYLAAFERVHPSGDNLVFRVAKPLCLADPEAITVALTAADPNRLSKAAIVTYQNLAPAAFVADVRQVSHLMFADGSQKNFTEPLVIPAGESQSVTVPLEEQSVAELSGAWLATLSRTAPEDDLREWQPSPVKYGEQAATPLGLTFDHGTQLASYQIQPEDSSGCSLLAVVLNWKDGQPGDSVLVQLLDPFGRIVKENRTRPWTAGADSGADVHVFPLPGSLPAGRYGLRTFVLAADGSERLPVTEEGVTIPTDKIPPLPVVIHPQPRELPHEPAQPVTFGGSLVLLGGRLWQEQVEPGDWLRFSLVWQTDQPLDEDLTVFTQLIGPSGQVWGQRDNEPGGGWYGTSLWLPGRPVVDDYAFQVQPGAPLGVYRLIAGLYRRDTLERLATQTGADFVEVGTVIVE